jgi:two-component system chemotaxis response regulator CheY
MARILEKLGFAVIEAETGDQAMTRCAEGLPAIAIIDSGMPDRDGFDIVRAIRRMPDGGFPKLVVSIVESDLATIARVLHAGADTYLMKPFTSPMLREKLEEVGLLETVKADAA